MGFQNTVIQLPQLFVKPTGKLAKPVMPYVFYFDFIVQKYRDKAFDMVLVCVGKKHMIDGQGVAFVQSIFPDQKFGSGMGYAAIYQYFGIIWRDNKRSVALPDIQKIGFKGTGIHKRRAIGKLFQCANTATIFGFDIPCAFDGCPA